MNKLQQERKERFLKNLIKEAIINVLAEQDELGMDLTQPAPVTEPATSPTESVPQEMSEEEFTVDVMVDKLNDLRGAKSFKDPEVYGKLNTFFNNLTEEQKTSTKWILDELVKLVTSVQQQPQVTPQTTTPVQAPAKPVEQPPVSSEEQPVAPITPNM